MIDIYRPVLCKNRCLPHDESVVIPIIPVALCYVIVREKKWSRWQLNVEIRWEMTSGL